MQDDLAAKLDYATKALILIQRMFEASNPPATIYKKVCEANDKLK